MLDEGNQILYIDNKKIYLNKLESTLLSLLINNKQTYLNSKFLNNTLFKNYVNENNIYKFIQRINKKIFPYIKICNKYNVGYKLKLLQKF